MQEKEAGKRTAQRIRNQGYIEAAALPSCAAFMETGKRMVDARLAAIAAIVKKLNFRLFHRLITYDECGQPFSGNLDAEPHDK